MLLCSQLTGFFLLLRGQYREVVRGNNGQEGDENSGQPISPPPVVDEGSVGLGTTSCVRESM